MTNNARGQWARAVRWVVGLSVAGLSCWLLARDVDWQSVVSALCTADYRWVIVGILAIVATFFTRAWRWQALLWQSKVRLQPTMTAILVGQVANLAVLAAFGIPSAVAALSLLAALMVGGTVPTPGRLGVFEGICVVSLENLFGVPFDQALAVGLVLHAVVMGPPLVATALLVFWPSRRLGSADGQA